MKFHQSCGNVSQENLALKEKEWLQMELFEAFYRTAKSILGALRRKTNTGPRQIINEGTHEMLNALQNSGEKGITLRKRKLGISLLEKNLCRGKAQVYRFKVKDGTDLSKNRNIRCATAIPQAEGRYILTARKEHVRSAENGFKRISKCFEKKRYAEDMIRKLQGELQECLFIY